MNGSGKGPDQMASQKFKDLVSRSNGTAGLSFLRSLTKLLKLVGGGKLPEPLRTFFFGAKVDG